MDALELLKEDQGRERELLRTLRYVAVLHCVTQRYSGSSQASSVRVAG
jgi:hypothetical protein